MNEATKKAEVSRATRTISSSPGVRQAANIIRKPATRKPAAHQSFVNTPSEMWTASGGTRKPERMSMEQPEARGFHLAADFPSTKIQRIARLCKGQALPSRSTE